MGSSEEIRRKYSVNYKSNKLLINFLEKIKKLYHSGNLTEALEVFSQNKITFLHPSSHPLDQVSFLLEFGKLLVINIRNYQPVEIAISTLKTALDLLITFQTQHPALSKLELNLIFKLHAMILDYIGFAHYFAAFKQPQRDFHKALDWIERSLEIQKNLNQDEIRSETLFHRGLIYEFSQNLNQAEQFYQESALLGSKLRKSYAYRHLSNLALKQNKIEKAIDFMIQALNLRQEIKFIFGVAYTHWGLGKLYMQSSKSIFALKHYENAISISSQINDYRCLMFVFDSLGEYYIRCGEIGCAIKAYQKGKEAASAINHQANIEYYEKKKMELS